MKSSPNAILLNRLSPVWFDRTLESLLVALLAFSPLAFGVVHAWSEQVVVTLIVAMCLVFLLKLAILPSTRLVWTWAYLPVALFLLIGALQLLPLPSGLVAAVSPHTHAWKTDLLGDLPNADEVLSAMTLSFYPHATRHDLRLMLAAAVVFVLVVNLYREPASIKRLLGAVAALGGALAVLVLAQELAGHGRVYGRLPAAAPAYVGTFGNAHHYGQFMSLSLGATLGLLLVELREACAGQRLSPGRLVHCLRSPSRQAVRLLLAGTLLGVAGLFASVSHAALVSLSIAAALTILVLSVRRLLRKRGSLLMSVALPVLGGLLYLGLAGAYDHLVAWQGRSKVPPRREGIVRDGDALARKRPLFGVGLGAAEVVLPMMRDGSLSARRAAQARGEYARILEETGYAGLLVLAAWAISVSVCYARSVRRAAASIHWATYGLGLGLAATLIHGLTDTGLDLPASALLGAALGGLVVALAPPRAQAAEPQGGRRGYSAFFSSVAGIEQFLEEKVEGALSVPGSPGRVVASIAVAGILVWTLVGAIHARVAEAHWEEVRALESRSHADDGQSHQATYNHLLSHATAAAAAEPDNIQYQYRVRVCKWLSLTPQIDPNTGQLQPEALGPARAIVRELHRLRPICPTFGAPYYLAGEIETFLLADPRGIEHIRQAYRLAPDEATVCLAAALVDADAGQVEAAVEKIARAVRLDRACFRRAALFCLTELNRPELALSLAGDDRDRRDHLTRLLSVARGYDRRRVPARAGLLELLEWSSGNPEAPADVFATLANLYRQRGDVEMGIQHYRTALARGHTQVSSRLDLARLLMQVGGRSEAVREAQMCLRLAPDFEPARRLIREWSAVIERVDAPTPVGP